MFRRQIGLSCHTMLVFITCRVRTMATGGGRAPPAAAPASMSSPGSSGTLRATALRCALRDIIVKLTLCAQSVLAMLQAASGACEISDLLYSSAQKLHRSLGLQGDRQQGVGQAGAADAVPSRRPQPKLLLPAGSCHDLMQRQHRASFLSFTFSDQRSFAQLKSTASDG